MENFREARARHRANIAQMSDRRLLLELISSGLNLLLGVAAMVVAVLTAVGAFAPLSVQALAVFVWLLVSYVLLHD